VAESDQVRKAWGHPWVGDRWAVDLGIRMVGVVLDQEALLEGSFQVLAEPMMMEVEGLVASGFQEEDSILMGQAKYLPASEGYPATVRWAFGLKGVAILEVGTAVSAYSMAGLSLALLGMRTV